MKLLIEKVKIKAKKEFVRKDGSVVQVGDLVENENLVLATDDLKVKVVIKPAFVNDYRILRLLADKPNE